MANTMMRTGAPPVAICAMSATANMSRAAPWRNSENLSCRRVESSSVMRGRYRETSLRPSGITRERVLTGACVDDIGLRGVIALEQDWQATGLGECVGEEVSEVELGRMAVSLAVDDECLVGDPGLVFGDRRNLKRIVAEQ